MATPALAGSVALNWRCKGGHEHFARVINTAGWTCVVMDMMCTS